MRTMWKTAAASAIALLAVTGCANQGDFFVPPIARDDYVQTVADREVTYATKRCTEIGVQQDSPEWQACLREKGAARWALKNCGGPFNSTSMWWPTLCAMADLD